MDRASDKPVTLVTGAASGIGLAIAAKMAAAGHGLALFDLAADRLGEIADGFAANGVPCLAIAGDASREADVAALFEATHRRFGRLDAVVCAAGIARTGDVRAMDLADWQRMMDVNLTSVFLAAKHGMDALIASGRGCLVAISSDAGVRGSRDYGAYCASKHGVIGLVRTLALDFGREGVRSNVVCPSFVDTPMADALLREGERDRAFYEARTPMGRFAKAEEVADAVHFLCSNEASYVNGLVFNLDGGTTAGNF